MEPTTNCWPRPLDALCSIIRIWLFSTRASLSGHRSRSSVPWRKRTRWLWPCLNWSNVETKSERKLMGRLLLATSAVVLLLLVVISAFTTNHAALENSAAVHQPAVQDKADLRTLQARYKILSKQLSHLMPTQPYILVDTARN